MPKQDNTDPTAEIAMSSSRSTRQERLRLVINRGDEDPEGVRELLREGTLRRRSGAMSTAGIALQRAASPLHDNPTYRRLDLVTHTCSSRRSSSWPTAS